jgi:hypothetical protein
LVLGRRYCLVNRAALLAGGVVNGPIFFRKPFCFEQVVREADVIGRALINRIDDGLSFCCDDLRR